MNRTAVKFLFVLFLPVFAAILGGCATAPVSPAAPTPTIYKSSDYIVYKMASGDTAALLAQRFLGDAAKSWQIEDANPGHELKPGNHIVIPLTLYNKGGINSYGVQTVPVLCYHRFGNHCESPLCIPEAVFESQMRYLKDNGYRVISPGRFDRLSRIQTPASA